MTTSLTPERYFELIDSDTDRLIAMGERGLGKAVPACTGWDVAEVLWHVSNVYEHKVRLLADNAWPDPWPPEWEFGDDEEVAFLRSAKTHLFEEFSRHAIDEPTTTFGGQGTVLFWVRRMACEIAVHRVDGEQAHGDQTPTPADLATDGVDELLHVFLAGPWWADRVQTAHPVSAQVAVETGSRRWVCDVQDKSVSVADESTTPAAATVAGEPGAVFLWLWGRGGDDTVTRSDETVCQEFRSRIAECLG